MDEMTRSDRGSGGRMSPEADDVPTDVHTDTSTDGPTGGATDGPTDRGPEQARLPFDPPPKPPPSVPLPFDDEADQPIGFALTARARRTVAPATLPALAVVDGDTEEDPTDTRPSRARALRRAGATVPDIARQLKVDELLVRAWASDVAIRPAARRGSAAARAAAVLAAPAEGSGAGPGPVGPGPARTDDTDPRLAALRREALDEGRRRLVVDAAFAAGVGLMAGLVEVDRHAVAFRTDRSELAGRVVAWAVQQAGADPRDVRVVLRLGPAVAGDLARHRWAATLAVGTEQVAFTRWRHAVTDDAIEALVRITDPEVAARVAGWCEALLQPQIDPADVAF